MKKKLYGCKAILAARSDRLLYNGMKETQSLGYLVRLIELIITINTEYFLDIPNNSHKGAICKFCSATWKHGKPNEMKLHLALKYSKVTYNIIICMQYHQSKDSNNSTKLTATNITLKIEEMIHELNIQSFNKGGVVTFSGKFCYWNNYDGDNPLFQLFQDSEVAIQSAKRKVMIKTHWNTAWDVCVASDNSEISDNKITLPLNAREYIDNQNNNSLSFKLYHFPEDAHILPVQLKFYMEKKQTSDTFMQSSTSAAAEIAKSFSTKSKKREKTQADNTIIQDDNHTTVQDNKHQEQRGKSSKKMGRKTERKTSK
ncbi:hypothetical protein RhiirA5_418521 [Rhizophagus irregularis]|uniref:BED-type domain-containing protein n=1 Tax=Rhizophagus irregularis TaxID=588596 RepID=A0A2N0PK42_9GLOM|nr:hypothetical protein RhiirA5_418521 [Rhizophagus irregularis]